MDDKKLKLCRSIYRNLLDFYVNCLHMHHYYKRIRDVRSYRYFYACCFDPRVGWDWFDSAKTIARQYNGSSGCVSTGLVFYRIGVGDDVYELRNFMDKNWFAFECAYRDQKFVRPGFHLYGARSASLALAKLYKLFIDLNYSILWFKAEFNVTDRSYLNDQIKKCNNFVKFADKRIHEVNNPDTKKPT